MVQDIFPYKLVNHYEKKEISEKDFVLNFDVSKVLCKLSGTDKKMDLEFPLVSDFGMNLEYIYLFTICDDKGFEQRYFLLREKVAAFDGFEFIESKQIKDTVFGCMHKVFAVMTGKHISDWYRDTQFCGRCGNKMVHSGAERAMYCVNCGNTVYPRIMPAVIVGILNDDKILLTKYNRNGYKNYALVAGFTEIGETLEQTVEREVMEETGLKVKNIRYYKSQPWGFANDILVGYYCEVDGSTDIHMDENELKLAEWVERKDVILHPTKASLTNEMMEKFKNGEI